MAFNSKSGSWTGRSVRFLDAGQDGRTRIQTAKGGAVRSVGRCDPVAGCRRDMDVGAVTASPYAA
ncbi:MAG: hypothetical protein M3Q16_05230, partial [Pseudomonadota bacterium]|nr:hypothetical protein [Pseudomonadota bacterium]